MLLKKILICIYLLTFCSQLSGQADFSGYKYSAKLAHDILKDTSSWVSIHIVLSNQLDYQTWNKKEEVERSELQNKQRKLIGDLKFNAQNTQGELLNFLQSSKNVEVNSIKPFWIVNAISCTVKMSRIPEIAARNDVRWIGLNKKLEHTQVSETNSYTVASPNKAEKGLIAIGAPEMWALGYTGYGRLAFIADTGTDPKHPAISNQYNGLNAGNTASWYSYGNSKSPYDCDRHGTHVTGTILGLDRQTNDTIGVAFNAKWIAGDILCGIGTEDNIGAFEWALNPDGNPETTDDIPDVINNSWYDPSLTELDCYSVYIPILESLEAAGIAVVFSAGNSGPEESTITPPHNINVNEVNSFTIGALNGNTNSLPIASFSSNGPSHCPGEGSIKIKPEVSAPGVQVRSCLPGGDYGLLNGTSMAAPHVSGAILLLKEAFPFLSGKELKLALYHSARDLGAPGEDNKYGMGIINVYDAYLYLLAKGYLPMPGLVENDVHLLKINHAPVGCENKLNPEILLENSGTDTLKSLEIQCKGSSFEKVFVWEGNIAPKERSIISVFLTDVPDNDGPIIVSLLHPNGQEDKRPLNNSKSFIIKISDRAESLKDWLYSENFCANSIFHLQAPETLPIQPYDIKWFNHPFDGEVKFTGKKIVIEEKLKIKSLFAELTYKDQVGLPIKSNSSGIYSAADDAGLIFDANSLFTLDSVTVYSEKIGIRSFYLYNENGDSLVSTRKYINKIGANFIKLNWTIPPGRNYRIVKKDGKELFSNQNNPAFPFRSSDDIVTIKSGTNGNDYNYFYDWKISYNHPCGRVPYNFSVRKDSVVGRPDFTLSADTLYLPGNNKVQVINNSFQLKSYHWDMGDGSIYTDEYFEHNYNSSGNFKIILNAIDEQNCVIASEKSLVVLQITSTNDNSNQPVINLTPNPVQDELYISMNQKIANNIKILLINLNGAILQEKWWHKGDKPFILQFEGLPKGIYLLQIQNGDIVTTKKIIKI